MILRAFSLLLISSQFFLVSSAFNISTIFISSTAIDTKPPPSHFLQDVLKAISLKQSWKLGDIRVSKVRNSRIGSSQKYEFRIRMGKKDLLLRFSEEMDSWKKLRRRGKFGTLPIGISSKKVLNRFELDGPFELRVDGGDELKLMLPVLEERARLGCTIILLLNITHSGLKRLVVAEGITVLVEGAREISLFHSSDFGLSIYKSTRINENRNQYWPFGHSLCMQLPPIHILGSASLLAYKTHNRNAHIKTTFLSRDMIELLPDKCYSGPSYKRQACPISALSKRLYLLENVMRSLPDERLLQNGISGFLKAKITMSTLVRFELELERDVQDDDTFWGSLAEWRTKPTSERVQFEVVARVEGERLMPLVVKKVRPFIAAESTAWSTLMSNISFTKFPSVLGSSEALTLDVKW